MAGLKDVIESSVSKVAPLLGSVLATPWAGVALSLIANAFGLHPSRLDEIASAVASPESAAKLAEIQFAHVEMLERIASQNYVTEVGDRKDARAKSLPYKDFMRHMAYLVTVGFFASLFMLFAPLDIASDARNLLSMLVGMLASKWQTIIDFFYGSSRPTKLKED